MQPNDEGLFGQALRQAMDKGESLLKLAEPSWSVSAQRELARDAATGPCDLETLERVSPGVA